MAGYSYFSYDQMTLLGIQVHSDELEFLQQAADMYDWEMMETEVEPKFKEAALNFRDGKHSFACPRKDELDEDLQESFPFLNEMAETDAVPPADGREEVTSDRNPKGSGRRGQDFRRSLHMSCSQRGSKEERLRLEHMGIETPEEQEWEKKGERSPNSEIGRI
jgi:hypothetical protein